MDLIDKFACFCKDGYTGKICENDIDVCKDGAFNNSLCFNGATCIDDEGSNFTCRLVGALVKVFYCFIVMILKTAFPELSRGGPSKYSVKA